jgi:hypothetical protein
MPDDDGDDDDDDSKWVEIISKYQQSDLFLFAVL